MSMLVILPLILLAGGFAARRWFLWARRDARSIEAHRSTLDLLEHVTSETEPVVPHGRTAAPHVRILGAHPEREPASEPQPTSALSAPVAAGRSRRSRPGPPVLAAAAAATVLVVASIAVAAWPSGGKAAPHHRAASLGARTEVAPPSTVASTTVATPVVTAVNTGATEATYAANTSTVRLTVAVVNPCWIELRSTSAAGPVVYEGVLQSGASQTFQELRGLWLRIGNPAGVAVHVDGQRVNLPSGSNPYNVSVTTGA